MKEIYAQKYKELGLKISFYRKLKGISQEELAESINKSLTFVGMLEAPNIARGISMDTLFDIAAVLGVPAYKFLIFEE